MIAALLALAALAFAPQDRPAERDQAGHLACTRGDSTLVEDGSGGYRLLMFEHYEPGDTWHPRTGAPAFDSATAATLEIGVQIDLAANGSATGYHVFKISIGAGRITGPRPDLGALALRLETSETESVEVPLAPGVYPAGYLRGNLVRPEFRQAASDRVVSGLVLQSLGGRIDTGLARVTLLSGRSPIARYVFPSDDGQAQRERQQAWARTNIAALRANGRCA